MSGEKQRIPLAEAESIARELVGVLGQSCDRIQVAGSIRRRSPTVGDIEIVCAPKFVQRADGLFGDQFSLEDLCHEWCDGCLADGTFAKRLDTNGRPAWGRKHKRALFEGVPVDLFSVIEPAQWGVILAIRTGPAEFSHRLVTPRRQGGLLPDWLKVRDGAIWHGDHPLATPEEQDVFAVIGLDWIPPERRTGTERAAVAS